MAGHDPLDDDTAIAARRGRAVPPDDDTRESPRHRGILPHDAGAVADDAPRRKTWIRPGEDGPDTDDDTVAARRRGAVRDGDDETAVGRRGGAGPVPGADDETAVGRRRLGSAGAWMASPSGRAGAAGASPAHSAGPGGADRAIYRPRPVPVVPARARTPQAERVPEPVVDAERLARRAGRARLRRLVTVSAAVLLVLAAAAFALALLLTHAPA